jgi:integrase
MAAKIKWDRGAWWIFTHFDGRRKKKRIGPTKADKRRAEAFARQINEDLARGKYQANMTTKKPLCCDERLRIWHATYAPTMKLSYQILTRGLIVNHLIPHFGSRDLREISEEDLMDYIRAKLGSGLAPATIKNALSVLRRLYTILEREELVSRNPASRIGELMRQVGRATALETEEVAFWSRTEIQTLMEVARAHQPRFAPLLVLLFSTGMRRGEALGLQWRDVDFDRGVLTIRRAITSVGLTTPKSGKTRKVAIAPGLASELLDVLAERRREVLAKGWGDVPEWVFCSEAGTPPHPRNVERVWERVRRRAQNERGATSQTPLCTAHVGDVGTPGWQEHSLGSRPTRACRSCADAQGLRPRDARGRS